MKKILLLCLLLTACGAPDPRGPLIIHKVKPYTGAPTPKSYGPWFVEGCSLTGGNQDFAITTKGQYEHGSLRMKLQSTYPLSQPPQIRVNTLNVPIVAEGRHRAFGFNLPFQAHQVATYASEHAYIFVTYNLIGETKPREGFLKLSPLLSGLGALSKICK